MARTRGAEADPVELVEEEIVLGPEAEGEIDLDEGPEAEGDIDGGELDEDGNPVEPEEEDVLADEPAPRRSGGGSQTIRDQRRARQAAEARAVDLERQLAEARGFQAGVTARQPAADPQAAQRAEQEFYASLELMAPAQAYQAIVARERQNVGNYVQGIEFRTNDRIDKQTYDIAARSSKVHQQYRSQVESTLAAERAQGRNPDREVILKFLVGNDVLERAQRAAPAQRAGAARRVAGQRTQPTGARGDVSRTGRRPAPGTPEHDEMVVMQGIREGRNVFE